MLKKLASPHLTDVYQPARDQFNGRGSFGNGGAMRAAPFALAFPDAANVKKVCKEHVFFLKIIIIFKVNKGFTSNLPLPNTWYSCSTNTERRD